MERNREARRTSILGSNALNRRRHRTNSYRESPDEDGGVELHESVRLRERVKKDRDRARDRERERERDFRGSSSRSKRRRAERLMNIGEGETSQESMNDEEDEDEETAAGVTILPASMVSNSENHHHIGNHHHNHSGSHSQQHNKNSATINISSNNHHLQHRKSFPPVSSSSSSSKGGYKAGPVWKSGDEIITVSVPRKARSASTKRAHDWISSGGNNATSGVGFAGGDQVLRQAASSPVRQGLGCSTSTRSPSPAAPMSPSSSNAFFKKKLKSSCGSNGIVKVKPPETSLKQNSGNPEELEIGIAEVLYGMMTQSQAPSLKREDPNICPNFSPLQAVAPKRKRPRQVPESSSYDARNSLISAKQEVDQTPKNEMLSSNLEKITACSLANGFEIGVNSVNSQGQPVPIVTESTVMDSDVKPVAVELTESRDFVTKEGVTSPKEGESPAVRIEDGIANPAVSEAKSQTEQKFEIDLMAPPPQVRLSPEREARIHLSDQKPVPSYVDADLKYGVSKDKEVEGKGSKEQSVNVVVEGIKSEGAGEEESEPKREIENRGLQFDLEKLERNGSAGVDAIDNKSHQQASKHHQHQEIPLKLRKGEPLVEKSGHQSKGSLPLTMPMANWLGGLPPMGYVPQLPGVVSMDGSTVAPPGIQPIFSQPQPKKCATHCYIASNIHCIQQYMKMNPYWQAATGSTSLFASNPGKPNILSTDLHGNRSGLNNPQEKGNTQNSINNHVQKDKGSQTGSSLDSAQRKQQVLLQQTLPPLAPSNLLGPAFILSLNQQQEAAMAASAWSSSVKSSSSTGSIAASNPSSGSTAASAMSFNYLNVATSETQYMVLQNNAYPFPVPAITAPANYQRTPAQAMPLFNGSFYSSQLIHPSQLQQHQAQPAQSSQLQQANQNGSIPSSSEKHLSSQQHRSPQNSGVNSGTGSINLQNLPSQKSQQLHDQHIYPLHQRHQSSELGGNEYSLGTDGKGSMPSTNIYGPNFPIPILPQNFAIVAPPSAAVSGSGNQSEKQPQLPLPPHSFALSFGPINSASTGQGIDMTSIAQSHATFQSVPEATQQNIQFMAATAAASKKNSEDKSGGGHSSATDDERKFLASKAQGGFGQSIAFTRSDLANVPVSSILAHNVVESSVQPIHAHVPSQLQHQQQMIQLKQLQQQQPSSNTSCRSSKMSAKFPNALSGFPQTLEPCNNSGSSSPAQSLQWKSSTRMSTSQASSNSSVKTFPHQQQSRPPQQLQGQISFGVNQKPTSTWQGQVKNSALSPLPIVGSPGTSGSPRLATSGSTNKMHQSPSSSSQQQPKKAPSILGNPLVAPTSSTAEKPAMQSLTSQQTQLFFSSPYSQPQSSTASGPSSFYMQQRKWPRPDPRQQSAQQPLTSTGVLSLSPPSTLANANAITNDLAKALAAATSTTSVKSGGLTPQGIVQAAQFAVGGQSSGTMLPNGFTYVHPVTAAAAAAAVVQVKPAEQRQPAG